jgi:hypothetical protein
VNAADVAESVIKRAEELKGTVIPEGVEFTVTRNYGATATDKAQKLIGKLVFATGAVVLLVLFALGKREAVIVGVAVTLTLAATLFASWAWGFTLNRVSLFALIFSIGILVDDAIVVVENIHRWQQLEPDKHLWEIIPQGGGRSRRPDHPRHVHRHRGAAADGLRHGPDGPLHEPHPDQRLDGHVHLAGHRLRGDALAGAEAARRQARCACRARAGQESPPSSTRSSANTSRPSSTSAPAAPPAASCGSASSPPSSSRCRWRWCSSWC